VVGNESADAVAKHAAIKLIGATKYLPIFADLGVHARKKKGLSIFPCMNS